jgi:hypothetical protein
MSSAELQIGPYGPVFISYRHSDGKSIADRVSILLKSVGVPVWIDSEAMQVGHIEKRVDWAIEQTISGAIVISTKDTEYSDVISNNEVPGFLQLLDNDPTFPICIINVNDKDAMREGLDYSAPDRRMRTVTVESDLRGPLSLIKQFGVEEKDLIALVGRWRRNESKGFIKHVKRRTTGSFGLVCILGKSLSTMHRQVTTLTFDWLHRRAATVSIGKR